MSRIRLVLEYDGTDFHGWQRQPGLRTVQGTLEQAMARLMDRSVACTGAGRTDAGVHARGQVAHIDLVSDSEAARIPRGLNSLLPDDVAVLDAARVTQDFHARYSAVSRLYSYRLDTVHHPVRSRYCACMESLSMDDDALAEACGACIGASSWRAMAKQGSDTGSFDVEVMEAECTRNGHGWTFRIRANRFLRGMVRLWVGTLVDIGRGRLPVAELRHMLASGDRAGRGASMPAAGLCLEKVEYDDCGGEHDH